MEKLHAKLLIVDWVNALLAPVLGLFGLHGSPEHPLVPDYLVMSLLILVGVTVLGLVIRTRLSVDHPGKLQIVLEDIVSAIAGLLDEWIGPKGRQFLPLIGTFGVFIFLGNYMGLVPGLMAPTSNINVTVGCALTTWVYYHLQGIRAQGLFSYVKHFMFPPGVPWPLALFLMFPIELISHASRALSLSLRLFGNIFGEDLVLLILALIVPYFVPVLIMPLALITCALQAYIFVLLSIVYLQGAVIVEHHDHEEEHGREHGHDPHPVAVAA